MHLGSRLKVNVITTGERFGDLAALERILSPLLTLREREGEMVEILIMVE